MEMTAETVYLTRGVLVIRDLCAADVEPIVAGEIAQGWQGATREKYDMRLRDAAGKLDGDGKAFEALSRRLLHWAGEALRTLGGANENDT